jgi:hypothetical protein
VSEAKPITAKAIYFLARGGIPTPLTSRKVPQDASWWCREGDRTWEPIETLREARRTKEETACD